MTFEGSTRFDLAALRRVAQCLARRQRAVPAEPLMASALAPYLTMLETGGR
jgi:hypothetical protein